LIWPEDGAIVAPILLTTKASAPSTAYELGQFLGGSTIGDILSTQGFFPSPHPEVPWPLLPHQTLWWVGWEALERPDLMGFLHALSRPFEQATAWKGTEV
jgi:ABC-type Fe3+ transport system substrate-binding protein